MFKETLRKCDFSKSSNFNVNEIRSENVLFSITHHSLKIKPWSFTRPRALQKAEFDVYNYINSNLSLCQGDITKINNFAVVNLANERILGEGGNSGFFK